MYSDLYKGETIKSERFPGKELYPHLFSPIRIGNIKLKNRIIAAPTSPSMMTTEGLFTPEMAAYMEEKALGGCAVATYGEAIPHSKTGKSHNKQLQLEMKYGVPAPTAKKKILVAGGGPAGMEAAITAAKRGHDVTLVEKADHLGGNLLPAGSAFFKEDILKLNKVMKRRVDRAGVKVLLNTEVTPDYVKTKVLEIRPEGVLVENAEKGQFLIEADSVVCALGFRAPYPAVDALCDLVDEYYIIGDCNKVGMIYQAMDSGYHAAYRV